MTPAEVTRQVRLRRLRVWRVAHEHFQLALEYCVTRGEAYIRTEYLGKPAVMAGDKLFIEGRD